MLDEISELSVEIDVCIESSEFIDQNLIKLLHFLGKIFRSDIINIKEQENLDNLTEIEKIIDKIFQYLTTITNIESVWNDLNFWLLHSIFFLHIEDVLEYFSPKILIKIKKKFNEIYFDVQKNIDKWKTNFSLEFVLNIGLSIFKDKKDFLNILKELKTKLKNTKEEDYILKLIDYLSQGSLDLSVIQLFEYGIEVLMCLVLLLLKFGKKNELLYSKNLIEKKIANFWSQILKLKKSPEISSYIRDWLCLRLLQIQINTKISSYSVLDIGELDFFSLSPRNFERLIFWIFKNKKKWRGVEWRGSGGGEKGKDILAIKKKNDNYWIIQVKRDKSFSKSHFEEEFKKVGSELMKYNCEGYQLFLARNATDDIYKCGEKLARISKYKIKVKDREEINYIVKNNPILLQEFFRYPKQH